MFRPTLRLNHCLNHFVLQPSSFGFQQRDLKSLPVSQVSQRSFSFSRPTQHSQIKPRFKKWMIGGGLTAIAATIGKVWYSQNSEKQPIQTVRIGDMQMLPNGTLLPGHFDVSKIDEYESKCKICDTLQKEILQVFENSTFDEMKEFIINRGSEFLIPMTDPNPWTSDLKSIYETALQGSKRKWSEEELLFVYNYYIENSEEAKEIQINLLHMLIKTRIFSYDSYQVQKELIKKTIKNNPKLLKERLVLEGLDMTPAEMAIRISQDESLIYYLLDATRDYLSDEFFEGSSNRSSNGFSDEEKKKLIFHASRLLDAGIYDTVLFGKRVINHIQENC